jgi:hypothetical protein
MGVGDIRLHSGTIFRRRSIRQWQTYAGCWRENLLALSDEFWVSIQHNDPEALEEGVQFKRAYNEKLAAFERLASELSALVQQFTSVRLEGEEQTGTEGDPQNVRLIQELNREVPHAIDENFTFKRPHGFILQGQAMTGVTTWRRLYELFCQQLLRHDAARFKALPENRRFISPRGTRSFATTAEPLRMPMEIGQGLYAEANLSANSIRDLIADLLKEFDVPKDELRIYLRQDRNAAEAEAGR